MQMQEHKQRVNQHFSSANHTWSQLRLWDNSPDKSTIPKSPQNSGGDEELRKLKQRFHMEENVRLSLVI